MTDLVSVIRVGEGCTIWDVTRVLRFSPSFPVFWEKRFSIAIFLGVDMETITRVDKNYRLDISDWTFSLYTLIQSWVSAKGKQATVGALCNVLLANELKACSELLEEYFRKPFEKKFCRMPPPLEQFIRDKTDSILLLLSPDTFITCEKIQEGVEGTIILSFLDFLKTAKEGNAALLLSLAEKFPQLKEMFMLKVDGKDVIVGSSEHEQAMELLPLDLCKAKDEMLWTDLTPAYQHILYEKAKTKLGSELKGDVQELLQGDILLDLMNDRDLRLFKDTIPPRISYYIERKVVARYVMSMEILKDKDYPDVLLIKPSSALDRSKIAAYANQLTDTSTSQLLKGKLTTRLIILDEDDHFKRISKLTSHPVHYLGINRNDLLIVVDTSGPPSILLKYQVPYQTQILGMDEENFFEYIKYLPNNPFCIASGPGMGKSIFLEEIGRKLKKYFPERIIVFSKMREFVQNIRDLKGEMIRDLPTDQHVIHVHLLNLACRNNLAKMLLKPKLTKKEVNIELLLDGLDEVDNLDEALRILTTIRKMESIRLIVTTRQHLVSSAQNVLGAISYQLFPFLIEDQIKFLLNYWEKDLTTNSPNSPLEWGRRSKEKILLFMKELLLNVVPVKTPNAITLIPLYTQFVADIFREEALEFAKSLMTKPIISKSPIILYEMLIQKIIRRYKAYYKVSRFSLEELTDQITNDCVMYSIPYLFPGKTDTNLIEYAIPLEHLPQLLRVGILELPCEGNDYKFIDPTIANYFASSFLLKLIVEGTEPAWIVKGMDNLFSKIFKIENGEFVNKTMVHFLNDRISKLDVADQNVSSQALTYTKCISTDNPLQELANAIVQGNSFDLFKLFYKAGVFDADGITKQLLEVCLPISIRHSSIDLVKFLFSHLENCQENKLQALEVALQVGNYDVAEYLIIEKQAWNQIKEFGNNTADERTQLLSICLRDSKQQELDVIEQKCMIIELLHSKDSNLILSHSLDLQTENVHSNLQELILKLTAKKSRIMEISN